MLKGLRSFIAFLIAEFLEGKTLTVTAVSDWLDYTTKQPLGTKVEVTVTEDNTAYPPGKNGQQITNLYEKMWIKVSKKVTVPIGAHIVPVKPVATVYGTYQNELSVRAEDIRVLPAAGSVPAAPVPAPARPTAPANPGKTLH